MGSSDQWVRIPESEKGSGTRSLFFVYLFVFRFSVFICVCAHVCVRICALVCLQVHMQEPDEGIGSLRVGETDAGRDAQFVTWALASKLGSL